MDTPFFGYPFFGPTRSLACAWEGPDFPRASGKLPGLLRISSKFPRSSPSTSANFSHCGCDFTIQPQTPPPLRSNPALKSRFRGRFFAVSSVFGRFWSKNGQNRPRNRLLFKGLLRVLGGAGEGGLWLEVTCHNTVVLRAIQRFPRSSSPEVHPSLSGKHDTFSRLG